MPDGVGEFQSLIGRLKTAQVVGVFGGADWFQSLIGRLKTPRWYGTVANSPTFQSLIGRLKTPHGSALQRTQRRQHVSIPHR